MPITRLIMAIPWEREGESLLKGERAPEQIALQQIAFDRLEEVSLFLCLDPFGDDTLADVMGHRDDVAEEVGILLTLDLLDEGPPELEGIKLQ